MSLPLARSTFVDLVLKDQMRDIDCNMELFRQILEGLAFLHRYRWVHCDIKPPNLGFISLRPPKAVTLDLGQARSIPESGRFEPNPGSYGTIGYLAPEMEQGVFDESIDVWALGVVGCELLIGSHPWMVARNARREGGEHLRPTWEHKYRRTVRELQEAEGSTIENLLSQMLRHSAAPTGTTKSRISASEALQHELWRSASTGVLKKRKF